MSADTTTNTSFLSSTKAFVLNLLRIGAESSIILIDIPTWRTSLLLQTQNEDSVKKIDRYEGFVDATKKIYEHQGVTASFRGSLFRLFTVMPSILLEPQLNSRFRPLFSSSDTDTELYQQYSELMTSSLSISTTYLLLWPLHFAAFRSAIDVDKNRSFSPVRAIKDSIFSEIGLSAGLRTWVLDLCQLTIQQGMFLGLLKLFQRLLNVASEEQSNNSFKSFLITLSASIIANIATYPINTIRNRLLVEDCHLLDIDSKRSDDMNPWKRAQKIANEEGIEGFYGGLASNLLRSQSGIVWNFLWPNAVLPTTKKSAITVIDWLLIPKPIKWARRAYRILKPNAKPSPEKNE